MKSINVTELKAHLSKYLRLASQGSRIVVRDRDEPIAQIGPPEQPSHSWRESMARQDRLTIGTQNWETLEISALQTSVDIQTALRDIREDAGEVPGR